MGDHLLRMDVKIKYLFILFVPPEDLGGAEFLKNISDFKTE